MGTELEEEGMLTQRSPTICRHDLEFSMFTIIAAGCTYLVGLELDLELDEPEFLPLNRLVLILALLDDLPLASVYSSCRLLSPTSRSSGVEEDFSGCFLLLGLFLFLYLKGKLRR